MGLLELSDQITNLLFLRLFSRRLDRFNFHLRGGG
jgi:hypothetical protein